MLNKKINFALVGCGKIAERHIDAIKNTNGAALSAVCDFNQDRVNEKAQLASVPAYNNYHDMLNHEKNIDVIIISTPSGMHYEHAKEILITYHKHIVLEKPMVMTVSQGYDLKKISDQLNLRIFPIYQNRFNTAVQFVKQALVGSELGKVRVGTVRVRWCRPQSYYDQSAWRGTWSMDGGAITNQGIHYIDLLRHLCGEVKRVHAKLATLGANIEVEDTAVAILEFENGALGVIEILTSARPDDFEASISCVCEKGLAVISGNAANALTTYSPDPSQVLIKREDFKTPYGYGHDAIINGIVGCLLKNKKPIIEFDDGLATIQLLHALYKSDEVSGWVDVREASSDRLGRSNESIAKLYSHAM